MEAMEHMIDTGLLDKRVQVYLIGVGGNGAQMASCLARLDIAIKALGHPYGLHVTAFDGDRVSEANIGRQLYSPSDVGRYKSVVTLHRLNQFYGLDWIAHPCRYEDHHYSGLLRPCADMIVSCVDSRAARRMLHASLFEGGGSCRYWLDLGNTEATAQVVLGEVPRRWGRPRADGCPRLPCVTELFPQLLDDTVGDDDAPSCSVRMSLASQGLFVNDVAVRFAVQLLYELFSRGRIRQHGVLINLDSKRCGPIDIDQATWQRFGYRSADDDVDAVAKLPQAVNG
jgi:PRTRC genetic system ThiF family protein